MRIHLLSDLHIGFAAFRPPKPDADLVILAGDIAEGLHGIRWAQQAFDDKPVLYIIGNHEYYGEALPRLTERLMMEGADWPIRVLERTCVEFNGVRFMGCTFWTDLALYGEPRVAEAAVVDAMSDFRLIRVSPQYRRFRPADAVAQHRASVTWLRNEWPKSDLPTVVVSHHAPSVRSLDPRFGDDPVNAAYASALDSLVERLQPVAWIHGHIHRAADYRLGATRVLCNPKGYPDEPSSGFDPGLVIEI